MRKFQIVFLCVFLASCLSEKNVDLAKPSTFIRYFSDGYNNDAVAIQEITDPDNKGFIILANSTIQDTEADEQLNRIVLIKTNEFGDTQWTQYYPAEFASTEKRWVANSLTLLPSGGYLVAGEQIQDNNLQTRKALIMSVDKDGNNLDSTAYSTALGVGSGTSVTAKAVTVTGSGSIILLATSPVDASSNAIHLAEISATLPSTPVWTRTYVQGRADIKNRLYYVDGATPFVYWTGNTQQLTSSVDGFVTKSGLNNPSTVNGQTDPIGTTTTNDFAGDFCQRGTVFGYVGYTDQNDAGDITFYTVNSSGTATTQKTYRKDIFPNPENAEDADNNKKEVGNSIAPTRDSGYIILGTIDTYTGLLGAGNTDLLLLKVSGNGVRQWSRSYGGLDADNGVMITQTQDGGYAVLGTSRVSAQRTILFIKTDVKGDIQ